MRELKFRAWDKTSQKMINDGFYLKPKGGTPLVNKGHGYPMLELMQYTGLKDKNGVEIYEGDWVELKSPNKLPRFLSKKPDIDGKYVLTWGYAGFQYEREPQPSSVMNDTINMGEHPHEIELEVIGNIYDNPELLK